MRPDPRVPAHAASLALKKKALKMMSHNLEHLEHLDPASQSRAIFAAHEDLSAIYVGHPDVRREPLRTSGLGPGRYGDRR